MPWTKRQFIEAAFSEIGLSGYVYNLTPAEMQDALGVLDSMMASWNAEGIRIGYPLAGSTSSSNIDDSTGVPDAANEAIRTNLALRLAPSYGKQPMPETKATAKKSYNTLIAYSTEVGVLQPSSHTPRGAGQKPWRWNRNPFLPRPSPGLWAGNDSEFDFE